MSIDDRIAAIAITQNWLISARQCLMIGMTRDDIRTRVRRGEWVLMARGVYLVNADLHWDGLPEQAWWRAAVLSYGPGSCIVGVAAVSALGISGSPPGRRPIEVAKVGGGSRDGRKIDERARRLQGWDDGFIVRQLPVQANEIVHVDGIPVRRADRSVIDAALSVDRGSALALLDSALRTRALTPAELRNSVAAAAHRPGIVMLRQIATYADGRAESPLESLVRLACIDGGVTPDDLQYTVRDTADNIIAVGDLAWFLRRARPLLAEADGESVHGLPAPVYRDRHRGNALVGRSCDTIRFTYEDTRRRGYIAWAVKDALRAA
ncbi:MAG: type IV toxin-antitoxin system AbiEi family antitoxin domain-containing protein [Frankiaceae bacterium]|nr:type IV toxin-antitoxin system AbiEi family antitoxin domain-containing protein [Frankiaceae bacterium]MBV9872222.1 type IV toxin-antitoxin system AbiEi family antitoxin domain-containing protein [Frankiaceae bacterium]